MTTRSVKYVTLLGGSNRDQASPSAQAHHTLEELALLSALANSQDAYAKQEFHSGVHVMAGASSHEAHARARAKHSLQRACDTALTGSLSSTQSRMWRVKKLLAYAVLKHKLTKPDRK